MTWSSPWLTSGWYGVYAVRNSPREVIAPTAEGVILSYAPAPKKIGNPVTFLAASLFTSESASYSETTGGRLSSPSNFGETSAKRSSRVSTPMASSISRTSSSVCGVNRAIWLYPLSGERCIDFALSQT